MLKRFKALLVPVRPTENSADLRPAGRLKTVLWSLLALNALGLFLCLKPPGGTRSELARGGSEMNTAIDATRRQSLRLRRISARVQVGGKETSDFQAKCILPKRTAYAQVIAEIQRMSKAAGLEERDGVFAEEPIEGTADLALLNITSNYQGTYGNLMHFLHEVDSSQMLLILDNLQAAPEQKGGQINVSIRFQVIIRDNPVPSTGVQP